MSIEKPLKPINGIRNTDWINSQQNGLLELQRATGKTGKYFLSAIESLRTADNVGKSFDLTTDNEIPEDGNIPQVIIARMLCSRTVLENGWNYYLNSLRASEYTDFIEQFYKQFENLDPGKESGNQELENLFKLSNTLVQNLRNENPLTDGRYPRPFFWRLADADHPLTEEYRETLDEIFEPTNEPADAALLAFFGFNDKKHDRLSWKDSSGKSADPTFGKQYDHLTKTIQLYFQYYRDRCLNSKFPTAGAEPEPIFPEQSIMLPVAVAVSFADHTDLLPEVFNSLLATDFIPGLDSASAEVIGRYYRDIFDKRHPNQIRKQNQEKLCPYQIAESALINNSTSGIWENLFNRYALDPEQEAADLSSLAWLDNPNTFRKVRNYLKDKIHTVKLKSLDVTVDISAYGEPREDLQRISGITPSIDLIVTDQNESSVILQIQPGSGINHPGRIFGIPDEYEQSAKPIIADILSEVRSYIESLEYHPQTKKPPVQRQNRVVFQCPETAIKPKTRSERMTEYAEKQNAGIKRKQSRINTVAALEQSLTDPETVISKKNFHIDLELSGKYLESLSKLPQNLQEKAGAVLDSIKNNTNTSKKKLKGNSRERINIHSVKVGDYRIIYVQTGPGKMLITDIKHRHISYEKLQADLKELERFQTSGNKSV